MPKPEGATPVALEVTSPADVWHAPRRIWHGRSGLIVSAILKEHGSCSIKSTRRLRTRRSPTICEARFCSTQGKTDAAETALRNASAADPQFLEARYNLARVPFPKKDYATARKELEALLGAISGGKEKQWEQLIRYQIFLNAPVGRPRRRGAEGDGRVQDDGRLAGLYYAQAAWAFQHGNPKLGNNWVANASNLYSAELNRTFAAPFSDLGWVSNATAPSGSPMPTPEVVQNVSAKAEATPNSATIVAKSVEKCRPCPPWRNPSHLRRRLHRNRHQKFQQHPRRSRTRRKAESNRQPLQRKR